MTTTSAPYKGQGTPSVADGMKLIREEYLSGQRAQTAQLIKLGYLCRRQIDTVCGALTDPGVRREMRAVVVSSISRELMPLGMSPRPTEMQVNRWCLFSALHEIDQRVESMPQGMLIYLSRWVDRDGCEYRIGSDEAGEYPLVEMIDQIMENPGMTAQDVRVLMDGEDENEDEKPSAPSGEQACTTTQGNGKQESLPSNESSQTASSSSSSQGSSLETAPGSSTKSQTGCGQPQTSQVSPSGAQPSTTQNSGGTSPEGSRSGSQSENSSGAPATPISSESESGAKTPEESEWAKQAQATLPLEKPMSITRTSSSESPEALAAATADEIFRALQNPAIANRVFCRGWKDAAVGILANGASTMIKHDLGANINAIARLFAVIAPTVLRFYEYDTETGRLKPKQRVVEM